jgi:hypothetical protein
VGVALVLGVVDVTVRARVGRIIQVAVAVRVAVRHLP